jgi:poly(3-hydroxybutyrate) depolymerase
MLRALSIRCVRTLVGAISLATLAVFLLPAPAAAQPKLRTTASPNGDRSYLESVTSAEEPAPLVVFLHGDERANRKTLNGYYTQWEAVIQNRGWHLVLPWTESRFSFHSEEGLRSIRAVVQDFVQRHSVDSQRIYLAGHGDGAPAVFAAISRMPDLWAAGLAIGGDANLAIETNRLFAGNAAGTPLRWLYEENREPVLRNAIQRLRFSGINGTFQPASEFRVEEAALWLGQHARTLLPTSVDYETGSSEFRRAHWAEILEFDFAQRNDVLPSTRVDPGTGAFLRLGGFGYDPEGDGPGVPVKWLPPGYKGPLQLEDCIVSIAGTMVQDAAHYSAIMESQRESRDVGIILLRKGKSIRIETRIVIPQRHEMETARILAEYIPEEKEILVVTRGVRRAMLRVPDAWAPVRLSWNGNDLDGRAAAGCWILESPQNSSSEAGATPQATPRARRIPCETVDRKGGV